MDNCLAALKARTPYCWLNPDYGKNAELPYSIADVYDAEARLARFAPLLAELFDEAAVNYGIIESELLEIPALSAELLPGAQMLLKAGHDLPVAGSIKDRGGIYNVLCFAEQLSYERLFVKFCLQKNRKKVDNQQKMIPKGCFCLAPIRVL